MLKIYDIEFVCTNDKFKCLIIDSLFMRVYLSKNKRLNNK